MNQTYLKYYLQLILVWVGISSALAQDSLQNEQLPDTSKINYFIAEIKIEGNQKTKERVILRELVFKVGDKFEITELDKAIEESKTHLLKQPLFNYVTIEKSFAGFNIVKITIIVEERWFIWPEILILNNDRNFNTWWQSKDLGKLDYKLYIKQYNMLGLNHLLRIGISYGYTRELSILYKNIFLDKKQHHYLGISANSFQQHSIFYSSLNNKQTFLRLENNDAIWGQAAGIGYTFRPRHKSSHSLTFMYKNIEIADSIFLLNNHYLANNQQKNSYFELTYKYIFDRRDSRGYPLHGNLLKLIITKTGFGINSTQSVDLFNVYTKLNQYYPIFNRFYGAHALSIKKSFEKHQPYYFKEGLGHDDFVRGFEYYVVEGEDYYLSRNTLKFELLPQKISYLKFIPLRKFRKIHYAVYLTTYFDIGIAHEKDEEIVLNNDLSNKLLYSTGLGLDIATYYDKVFRFEYSLNSLNQTGFFIHFRASF